MPGDKLAVAGPGGRFALDETAARWWIAGSDSPAKTTVTWHHRRSPGAFGAELAEAARAAEIPAGTRIWVACEAGAMRGIRRYFTRERGLPLSSMVTRGYWRLGEANHPDHDYGDDEVAS